MYGVWKNPFYFDEGLPFSCRVRLFHSTRFDWPTLAPPNQKGQTLTSSVTKSSMHLHRLLRQGALPAACCEKQLRAYFTFLITSVLIVSFAMWSKCSHYAPRRYIINNWLCPLKSLLRNVMLESNSSDGARKHFDFLGMYKDF